MRARQTRWTLPALLILVSFPLAGSQGERPPEQQDDPPIAVETAERTEAVTVTRGNHVSIQVNTDGLDNNIVGDAANEPSIAIDPMNPDNLVIGWRQFDTIASNFRQAGWAYSHDGGATWTYPGVLQPGVFRSDPVLAADSDGTFFYYSLSTATSVEMFISTDKGLSWVGPIGAFGGDKNWLTVDVTGGTGDGHVYTLWNSQFTCCAPGTDFSRSTDGGFTYEGPYALPLKPKWGTMDVGPGGELFVVGTKLSSATPPAHLVQRSTNAPLAIQTPTFDLTAEIDLGGFTAVGGAPNPGGLMGQVWVAVDRSGGATQGNVYVLGSVDPPSGADPLDVMLVRSTDGGATWTPPIRVNDDPVDNGAWQWFGTMSVAPDGRIDVVWNDTRNDPTAQNSELYYAWSTDAGNTWSSGLPVSPPYDSLVGHPNQNKIGDYYHMFSDLVGAGVAYSATFNGEQDVWFLRVGDCNLNGQHDSKDIALGSSDDCNGNRIPDECDETTVEMCDDGIDNDCDGFTDCTDTDCTGDPSCPCDFDTICEAGEDCVSCPGDCFSGAAGCGNGVCEQGQEDCLSCPADCAGDQSGGGQFCCGALGGTNPVPCADPRCNDSGFTCLRGFMPACCGDLACTLGEDPCVCGLDCGPFSPAEDSCADGIDNDCDGIVDCADADCATAAPAPPAGSPAVDVVRDGLDVQIRWTPAPFAIAYDVVEGSIASLRSSGGDYSVSTTSCLAGGVTVPEVTASPFSLEAWFLVRSGFCSATGPYDTGGAGQAAARDAGIAASGNDCP